MKDFPHSFWAAVFIAGAVGLAVIALYAPAKENVVMAVLAIASNIVSGALGYIQGSQSHSKDLSNTNPIGPNGQEK